jgi:hypothetical protein
MYKKTEIFCFIVVIKIIQKLELKLDWPFLLNLPCLTPILQAKIRLQGIDTIKQLRRFIEKKMQL